MISKLIFLSVFLISTPCMADSLISDLQYFEKETKVDTRPSDTNYLKVAVSENNQYIAVQKLMDKENGLVKVSVYDTQNFSLQNETTFVEKGIDPNARLQFLPNNKVIFLDGFHGDVLQYIWKFTETKKISRACPGFSLGYIADISKNNKTILYKTYDGAHVLCNLENKENLTVLVGLEEYSAYPFLEENTNKGTLLLPDESFNYEVVLSNKKLLVIYNYGLEKNVYKKVEGLSEKVEFWDINYVSKAPRYKKLVDAKNKTFMLFELFKQKTIITQWDYENKKLLNTTTLKFPVKTVEHKSDKILLNSPNNKITLLTNKNRQLGLKWTKQIDEKILKDVSYNGTYLEVIKGKVIIKNIANPKFGINKYHLATLIDNHSGAINSYFLGRRARGVKSLDKDGRFLIFSYQKGLGVHIYDTYKASVVMSLDSIKAVSNDTSILVTESDGLLSILEKIKGVILD